MELADANSKFVEIVTVTVANVDDGDDVGNSLLQIWKLRFGHKDFCLDFKHFGQDFEVEIQARF